MGKHIDHAVIAVGPGWRCEACPFRSLELLEALHHSVTHQYDVAPPKPLPERPKW